MGSALLSSTRLEWVAAMNSTIEPRWKLPGTKMADRRMVGRQFHFFGSACTLTPRKKADKEDIRATAVDISFSPKIVCPFFRGLIKATK